MPYLLGTARTAPLTTWLAKMQQGDDRTGRRQDGLSMIFGFCGHFRRSFGLSFCSLLAATLLGAGPALADLLPHRATYALSLSPGTAMSGRGLMSFEIRNVCDGWAVDMNAELVLAGEDGQVHRLGWSQVTWEAKDGSRYRYFMRELSDAKETSRRRGEARRATPQDGPRVITDLPQQSEFDLPPSVMFPVEHTQALIKADAAGTSYLLAQLFDGAVGDSAIEIGAALGPGSSDWRNPGEAVPALDDLRSFPVALAFFMGESPEGLPDTEQQLRLYENGVVADLVFDLGELQVQARLDSFQEIPAEPC